MKENKKIIVALVISAMVLLLTLFTTKEVNASSSWSNYDIRTSSNITANDINTVINKYGKSSKIKNSDIGTSIMGASEKHGVSPQVLFAMLVYETGWGSSDAFLRKNNVGGLQCMPEAIDCSERWAKFATPNDSIYAKARLLSGDAYIGQGRTTILKVIEKYAPSHENDVSAYVSNVGTIIHTYLGVGNHANKTVAQVTEEKAIAKAEEERKAKELAELKAREEAEHKAMLEAKRKAEEEEKARLEAERILKEQMEKYKLDLNNYLAQLDMIEEFEKTFYCKNSINIKFTEKDGFICNDTIKKIME